MIKANEENCASKFEDLLIFDTSLIQEVCEQLNIQNKIFYLDKLSVLMQDHKLKVEEIANDNIAKEGTFDKSHREFYRMKKCEYPIKYDEIPLLVDAINFQLEDRGIAKTIVAKDIISNYIDVDIEDIEFAEHALREYCKQSEDAFLTLVCELVRAILSTLSVQDASKAIFYLPMLATIDFNTLTFGLLLNQLNDKLKKTLINNMNKKINLNINFEDCTGVPSPELITYVREMATPNLELRVVNFIVDICEENKLREKNLDNEEMKKEFKLILFKKFADFLINSSYGLFNKEHDTAWYRRIELITSVSDIKIWNAMVRFHLLTPKEQHNLIRMAIRHKRKQKQSD